MTVKDVQEALARNRHDFALGVIAFIFWISHLVAFYMGWMDVTFFTALSSALTLGLAVGHLVADHYRWMMKRMLDNEVNRNRRIVEELRLHYQEVEGGAFKEEHKTQ